MNISTELLKIANIINGGIFKVPRGLLQEVVSWTQAQWAANKIYKTQETVEKYKRTLIMEQAALALEDDERRQKRIQDSIDDMEKYIKRLEDKESDLLKILNNYPSVRIKEFKRVAKNFKVDLSDWDYFKNIEKLLEDKKSAMTYLKEEFGTLRVVLVSNMKKSAYWNPTKKSIFIPLRKDMESTDSIEHEIMHFAQEAFRKALFRYSPNNVPEGGGFPSKKIRNPEVDQNKKLKNFDKNDLHSLDDYEFYPMINTSVNQFVEMMKRIDADKDRIIKDAKAYVGQENNALTSNFFSTLKKYARGKYKKAVKEFYKEISRKLKI